MRRWYVLQAVIVIAFLALFAIVSVAQGAESSTKPLTGIVTKFDGEFTVTYLRVHPKFAWAVIGSTEGWAEIDAGANFTPGGWFLQPMLGVDFSRNIDGKMQAGKYYAQFYGIYWKPVHFQAHAVWGIPASNGVSRSFTSRLLLTGPIHPTKFLLGVQGDYQSNPATLWAGPRVDLDVEGSRISFCPQWSNDDASRFTLTYVTFF